MSTNLAERSYELIEAAGVAWSKVTYRDALLAIVASDPSALTTLSIEAEEFRDKIRGELFRGIDSKEWAGSIERAFAKSIVSEYVIRVAAFIAYGAAGESPRPIAWLTGVELEALKNLAIEGVRGGLGVIAGLADPFDPVGNAKRRAKVLSFLLREILSAELVNDCFQLASRVGAASAGVDMLDERATRIVRQQTGKPIRPAIPSTELESTTRIFTSKLALELKGNSNADDSTK